EVGNDDLCRRESGGVREAVSADAGSDLGKGAEGGWEGGRSGTGELPGVRRQGVLPAGVGAGQLDGDGEITKSPESSIRRKSPAPSTHTRQRATRHARCRRGRQAAPAATRRAPTAPPSPASIPARIAPCR